MNNKNNFLQPFLMILLVIMTFFSGILWMKLKEAKSINKNSQPEKQAQNNNKFQAKKSKKPIAKFFVMSFCPYGNQAESGLEPVYQLLKNKVDWQPRYVIYDKTYCNNMIYDEKRCQQLVDDGKVKDLTTCKKYFPMKTMAECAKKYCLQGGDDYYCSMHGIGEINQDIREICLYNQEGAGKFWQFVSGVNKKCTAQNVEDCWIGVAKELKLNTQKISQCQEQEGVKLLKKEVAENTKYNVKGSPTIFFNEVKYDGGRKAEDYKGAICASFEKEPKECKTVLSSKAKGAAVGACN